MAWINTVFSEEMLLTRFAAVLSLPCRSTVLACMVFLSPLSFSLPLSSALSSAFRYYAKEKLNIRRKPFQKPNQQVFHAA
jgi:hypothetical protein